MFYGIMILNKKIQDCITFLYKKFKKEYKIINLSCN